MNNQPTIFIAKLPNEDAQAWLADAPPLPKGAQPWLKTPIYPPERQAEILACASEKVRKEKYFVWKLLELALLEVCEKRLQELTFSKSEHGKWHCDGVEFSLSHSEKAVCVAVVDCKNSYSQTDGASSYDSEFAIGVDLQRIKTVRADGLAPKILTEAELCEYHALDDREKNAFLIHSWAKKESLFKAFGEKGFFTSDPQNLTGNVWQNTVTIDGEDYALAVATKEPCSPTVHFVELSV